MKKVFTRDEAVKAISGDYVRSPVTDILIKNLYILIDRGLRNSNFTILHDVFKDGDHITVLPNT